ncbi:hypothetical protein AVHY2522_07070 [Acidovorax sp. SUPP2522]|uniref:hypothetical protein n=1 Tax=unclassified Acidovorax TaxID=2684926 RepID=UPI00234BFF4D|nr:MULTISPECIES: hypothetical protein [unclassified Acidovorax]WCM97022.1 hypothetical protein M5C96_21830 [Acidovorax sp. GBBC 1281]GKT15125.1 hypothetical protein AVHY2522_07070 [Acidovorax sp. SUPP2522]
MQLNKCTTTLIALILLCASSANAMNVETAFFSFNINPELKIENDEEKRIILYNNKNDAFDPFISIEYTKKEPRKTMISQEDICSSAAIRLINEANGKNPSPKITQTTKEKKYLYTATLEPSEKTYATITYYCDDQIEIYIGISSPTSKQIVNDLQSNIIETMKFKKYPKTP